MKRHTLSFLTIITGLLISGCMTPDAGKGLLWGIGVQDDADREFDANVRSSPETVVFDLGSPAAQFPGSLGTDIGKQRSVVKIRFAGAVPGSSSLNIFWSAGGSESIEQFRVELDGVFVGNSSERKGEMPYKWRQDTFMLPKTAGRMHTLTLTHLKGDGLCFDYISLVR